MHKKIDSAFLKKYHPALLRWYERHHRQLPWRETDDPYAIWVSEVMLQQTQVRTVIPYYTRFMQQFPDVRKLAAASRQTVLKLWEGLGYYGRARNLHRAAGLIVHDHEGRLPRDWKRIRRLPGVGDYIAAAVLSIAFNQCHAVVDGNVKRVIARLFRLPAPVNQSSSKKEFNRLAGDLLQRSEPGTYNQALMELGALVCTPARPACGCCPLQALCAAAQSGAAADYPKKVRPRATPTYPMCAGVVLKADKMLIVQRSENGLLGGLWEFPGGYRQKGESARRACIRRIKESTGMNIEICDYLTSIKHAYTHFKIEMDVFLCRTDSSKIRLNGPIGHRWVDLDDIDQYPLHKANHKFMPRVRRAIEKARSDFRA